MKENLIEKAQNIILPFANKFGNQRHVQAVSGGLMYIVPLSLLAAIFNIIANPPITEAIIQEGGWYASILGGWYSFAQSNISLLTIPSNMTMGLISVFAVLGISYNLATHYKLKGFSTSILSLVMFLIVAAPTVPAYLQSQMTEGVDLSTLSPTNVLNTTFLGAAGLFVAIIIALTSTEITRFCIKKNLVIKMPSSVPPMVSESFSSVIPAIINCFFFYGLSLLVQNVLGASLPELVMQILTPAINNVNTPFAIISIITFGNLLWLFGIHGAAIVSMLYIPLVMQVTAENAAIVASGGQAIYHPVFLTGYANVYFGLTFLMLFAKSSQLKAIAKVAFIPSLFVINEPVIFGAPIMFNPILAIPHLLTPIITMTLAWVAASFGWLHGTFNLIFAQLPLGFNEFFGSMAIQNLIVYFVLVLVSIVCWYPFVKMYDNQLLKEENSQQNSTEGEASTDN